jgi:hypothetical protein
MTLTLVDPNVTFFTFCRSLPVIVTFCPTTDAWAGDTAVTDGDACAVWSVAGVV